MQPPQPAAGAYPHQQSGARPTELQQGAKPPKHRPNRKALAILGSVVGVFLIGVAVVGILLHRDYQATFGIHQPPNADHLTAFPSGEAPATIGPFGNFDGVQRGGLHSYGTVDDRHITFVEESREYWDTMARGKQWEADGDLLADVVHQPIWLLAFTDRTLVIQPDDTVSKEEMLSTLDQFLAGKRGEEVDPGWGSVEPPNVSDLAALADKQSALPDSFDDFPVEHGGPEEPVVLWSSSYGSIHSFQASRTETWQYHTGHGDLTTTGPVLWYTSAGSVFCVLAGSDAIVTAFAPEYAKDEVIKVLTSLVE